MKLALVICDGMADEPIDIFGGKTPLEKGSTPAMDRLAEIGRTGSLKTIPDGKYPGSEVGILTILGYAPDELPNGRGPLEAAGLGIEMQPTDIAMRYSLQKPEEFSHRDLKATITEGKTYPLSNDAGLYILPAGSCDIKDTDSVKFWSADRIRNYTPFDKLHFGKSDITPRAAIIGAVPLLKGIASAIGAEWIKPDGATGDLSTDYKAKGEAAIKALECHDVVVVHVEACDWASHHKDPQAKMEAIEKIDTYIISPLFEFLQDAFNPDVPYPEGELALAVISDHPSLCSSGNHTSGLSPCLYFYPHYVPDKTCCFSEKEAAKGRLKSIEEIW